MQLGSNDVDGVFFYARGFVGVGAVFQAPFNINRTAFFDELAGDFSQAVIKRDPMPLGVFDHLAAVAVFAFARCGHADVGYGLAAG